MLRLITQIVLTLVVWRAISATLRLLQTDPRWWWPVLRRCQRTRFLPQRWGRWWKSRTWWRAVGRWRWSTLRPGETRQRTGNQESDPSGTCQPKGAMSATTPRRHSGTCARSVCRTVCEISDEDHHWIPGSTPGWRSCGWSRPGEMKTEDRGNLMARGGREARVNALLILHHTDRKETNITKHMLDKCTGC